MPETQENENLVRARRLLQGTADERHSECVKIGLYKISNNLLSVDENSYTEWEIITEMLEASGIMKAPLQPRDITDATMAAIMEKLFQRTMRNIVLEPTNNSLEKSSPGRSIKWLLQSGQSPDIRIDYSVGGDVCSETPLQMAAQMRSLQLMPRLLDHGASPDLSFEPWDEFEEDGIFEDNAIHPLLETVSYYDCFDEGRLDIIERLLKMTSSVSMDSIIRMIMNRGRYFSELMEVLIQNGADIFQSIKATKGAAWFVDTFSIIACTVKHSCEPKKLHPFFRLLENAGIQNLSEVPEALDTTSIVLLAAAEGNTAFLEDLRSYGIDTTAPGNLGSSAIHVAAYYGHLETCERLVLEHHAPVNAFESTNQIPSPLHFAVGGGNLGIVRLFHDSKVDVNEVFEDQQ